MERPRRAARGVPARDEPSGRPPASFLRSQLSCQTLGRSMPLPVIDAEVTFIPASEGGRSCSALDSPLYRPHLVVGDPRCRTARVDHSGCSTEAYLGVQFTGNGSEMRVGFEHKVRLRLVYHPRVDYSALVSGCKFTIREGCRVVGSGRVL